ncbi:MAG: hypothetical protein M3Q48_03205 [Actinomycetota bacterium]|jgi:hypothetical protein|nr:hypothetical protein [Actinomycetota bacterium]
MLTLVVVTAAVLGVALIAALVAALIFVTRIRSCMVETSAALSVVDDGASRLAGRLQRMQHAVHTAASELAGAEK